MIENIFLFYIIVGSVFLLVGLAKGGLGGTLGALATPLMAIALPYEPVIGTVLPILIFADLFAVAFYWKQWNSKLLILLLPGSIIGVTIGTWLITSEPTAGIQRILGIIVLFFVVYKAFEKRILRAMKYSPKGWHGVFTGGISGFSSSLAHIGGPPVSIYLLLQDLTPSVFVGTSVLFLMILNWIKIPYYIYADLFDFQRLWQIGWLAPLVPLGVWLGKSMVVRIHKELFEQIIVGLLFITGVMLVI